MNSPRTGRRSFLAGLVILLGATSVGARVGSMSMEEMVQGSTAIGIVTVDRIEMLGGMKVASATVIRPFKGVRAKQKLFFVAQPTWTCDTSEAVEGERTLLLLKPTEQGHFSGAKPDGVIKAVRQRHGAGAVLLVITHHGQGRLPISTTQGEETVPNRPNICGPANHRTLPTARGLQVPLKDVTKAISRMLGDGVL